MTKEINSKINNIYRNFYKNLFGEEVGTMSKIADIQNQNCSAVNKLVLAIATAINERLKKDIFSYEDILNHNFTREAGHQDTYSLGDYLLTEDDAIKTSKKILSDVYIKIESYCKKVILNINVINNMDRSALVIQVEEKELYSIYNKTKGSIAKQSYKPNQTAVDLLCTPDFCGALPIPIRYDTHILASNPNIEMNSVSPKVADCVANYICEISDNLIECCCVTMETIIETIKHKASLSEKKASLSEEEEKIVWKILRVMIDDERM